MRNRRRLISRVAALAICSIVGVTGIYIIEDVGGSADGLGTDRPMVQTEPPLAGGGQTGKSSAPGQDRHVSPAEGLLAGGAHINSRNAVLMDVESGEILFDRNGTERMYPASLTKIMTALVALEHIEDMDTAVVLNDSLFLRLEGRNAATAGFLPGEYVCAGDLLYGLLLPSGAECAIGLAEYAAGSESDFVSWMNDKARELGLDGTHFTNTTGLHDAEHYSTAEDMAALFRYALSNDRFYEMITSARHSVPPTNMHREGFSFESTLFSAMNSPAFDGGEILGGKTGYTTEAGQCLASFAEKNGRLCLLVTAGAYDADPDRALHIDDAFAIYSAI